MPASFFDELFRNCRPLLALLGERHVFSVEIGGRGFRGTRQDLCLRNVRLFGSKSVLADHVWVAKTQIWNSAEPLIQGRRLAIDATPTIYDRNPRREIGFGKMRMRISYDAGLVVHRVFRLDLPKPDQTCSVDAA